MAAQAHYVRLTSLNDHDSSPSDDNMLVDSDADSPAPINSSHLRSYPSHTHHLMHAPSAHVPPPRHQRASTDSDLDADGDADVDGDADAEGDPDFEDDDANLTDVRSYGAPGGSKASSVRLLSLLPFRGGSCVFQPSLTKNRLTMYVIYFGFMNVWD